MNQPTVDAPTELPLTQFAPVTLDELVAEAALLTRIDRKYLVPFDVAAGLVTDLDARVLDINGQRSFAYDSVYFDTDDSLAHRLTAQRRRRRFKLRTRSYLDTGSCFLEVKTKNGRGGTVKERIPYAPHDRARLTPAGRRFVAEVLGCHGHEIEVADRLTPHLVSRYRRSTLMLPCGSRATFDTSLVWLDADSGAGAGQGLALSDYAIVETKSAGRASDLDRQLWRRGYRPSRISKFGTGMAALHPELPRNKWARVLSGPFAAAATRSTRTIQTQN